MDLGAAPRACPRCATPLSDEDPSKRLCPGCLLALALDATITDSYISPTAANDANTPAPLTFAPVQSVGRYRLLELLGEGGMGCVYLAEQEAPLRRQVAIKILKTGFISSEGLARFENERQALASLHHPAIAQVYDAGTAHDGRPYFVMEYVPGLSLTEYCDTHRLNVRQRLGLFVSICDAIHHAHQNGIVHRDLKPGNILVSSANDRPSVKIIDFGLAKAMWPQPTERILFTQLGLLMGTPEYMGPEQADPFRRNVDHRSDIYSLGAILYELLTGFTPLEMAKLRSDGSLDVLRTLREEKVPSLSARFSNNGEQTRTIAACRQTTPPALARALKGEVQWIVEKALEKKAEHRYVDAAAFATTVECFLGRRPVLIRRLRLAYRARRFFVRQRVGVMATATVAMAVLFGFAANRFFGAANLERSQPTLVPLTSFSGDEMRPALSPDGTQVAFFWGGERNDDGGLYVTSIGAPEIRRLTKSPNHDNFVKWSPDGRSLAFARFNFRSGYVGARIHAVSPSGGPDVQLSDFPASGPLSWSADGRYIAASRWARADSREATGVFVIPVSGGRPRPLTRTQVPAYDTGVAFSADGHQLAYASCTPECDVYILALNADLSPLQPPKRITAQRSYGIGNITWARDGRSIIYDSVGPTGLSYLARVDVNGRRSPERIELAGLNAFAPSTARMMDRMVFCRNLYDQDIYVVRTDRSGAMRVLSSSFSDNDPQFSPRGDRIVFASSRSGRASELWISNSDGSRARRLVDGPGQWQGSPQWSPDGQRIAFQSLGDDGRPHVWTIDAEGNAPARLTTRTSDEWFPSWSRDGQMIYFSTDEGPGSDIWRASSTGGTPDRVTFTESALKGFESPDGTRLVYQERSPRALFMSDALQLPTRVLVQPLGGGVPAEVVDCAMGGSLSAGPKEFYYADCGEMVAARALNLDTGVKRFLTYLEAFTGSSIAVRADGKNVDIMYVRHNAGGVDLFMIENFK